MIELMAMNKHLFEDESTSARNNIVSTDEQTIVIESNGGYNSFENMYHNQSR